MKHNSNPPKRRRKVGEVIQDVKHKMRAKKGSRKIKRTLKEKAEKASKEVSSRREERRGERREKLEAKVESGTKRVQGSGYVDQGGYRVYSAKEKDVPTLKGKRASRTLARMEEQDKKRRIRKIKRST